MSEQMTELEMLRAKQNAVVDQSLEATRRMVKTTDQSKETSAAALVELNNQGEKLRNINEDLDHINQDMKDAEKNMDELDKCCGCIVLPWKKRKEFKPTHKSNENNKTVFKGNYRTESPNVTVNTTQQPSDTFQFKRILKDDDREKEMETNLQLVHSNISDIRTMAMEINTELKSQNQTLENLNNKAGNTSDRVRTAEAHLAKHLDQPKKKEEPLIKQPNITKMALNGII